VIGERITLEVHPSASPSFVRIDPGQLQQILVNLALNARDAMPTGGTLILCADCSLDGSAAPPPGFHDFCISDTGIGMTSETIEHIFEPFFTTKDVGKGTGLGLSTCYGIVSQSGGSIDVTSTPGKGSRFRIRLPRGEAAELGQTPAESTPHAQAHGDGRVVLLAEDDPLVREFTATALQRGGYRVLVARDGTQALELAKAHEGTIDLLLTDLVMPGLTGRDLAVEIRRQRPGIAVLYATGYEPDSAIAPAETLPGSHMIQKPFTASELLQTMAELCVRDAGAHRPTA
jgi:CheY-like chemotaxis protein